MLRPEGLARHALDAERLAIKPAFTCKILDNLLELVVTCGLRARPRVKSDRTEKVVGTQPNRQCKHEVTK